MLIVKRCKTSQCTSIFKRCLSILQQKRPERGDKVVVAMSGGVDSSVSAALLKQQGFDVQGIYMRNWDTSDERGVCTSREDWEDVQKVCHHLDIPCQQVNFVKEYWQDVFEKTLEDYAHGLTPNPDIACNSSIKFGALLNKIPKDAWFATGHYCRSTPEGKLLRGLERKKDQSYYLSNVPEEAISRTLFPLGDFTSKAAVKDLAHQLGLGGIAAKKESMGICFVGQRKKFADFLKEYIDLPPGPAINLENGQVIGEHQGLYGYTIGQASRICYRSDKWFVAEKDIKENKLICVPGSNHPALFHMGCRARDWKWIHHAAPSKLDINGEIEVEAQIRYRQSSEKAILSIQSNRHPTIIFKRPIRAIARGQQVVVWDQDWCLGGGVIEEVLF